MGGTVEAIEPISEHICLCIFWWWWLLLLLSHLSRNIEEDVDIGGLCSDSHQLDTVTDDSLRGGGGREKENKL